MCRLANGHNNRKRKMSEHELMNDVCACKCTINKRTIAETCVYVHVQIVHTLAYPTLKTIDGKFLWR